MSNFQQIESAFEKAKEEQKKFWEDGNAAAGRRYRKLLQQIKLLVHLERNAVTIKKQANLGKQSKPII